MTAMVLDFGNTRWKSALACQGAVSDIVSDEYAHSQILREWLVRRTAQVDSVWLSSVVDDGISAELQRLVKEVLNLPIHRVKSTDVMPGLTSGYQKPEQLGVDRLLAMVAVRALTETPFCVIDAGTAVTIDFVDADGMHLGGFILPGENLQRESLLAGTSIPRDAVIDESAMLGRDTPTAVALGARYAVAGIVERFTTGSASLWEGMDTEIYLGGGGARRLLPVMHRPCHAIDDLVLRGLAALAAFRSE